MLDEAGIEYEYREYTERPLDESEINRVLGLLGLSAREVLRRRDRMFKELDLVGNETEERLIALMAAHPTLLQRPIGIHGKKAILGRPPQALLNLMT